MDLLFLHTPKFHNYYKPIGEFLFILFPPIGLLGLADYLVRNQRTARIIHLAVEQHVTGSLDFERIIAENQPAIVGLDLHWHFQSYDLIEVARKVKQRHPEIAILLGGFTASFFAEEILRDHPFVDFVIRGDAEIPVLELVRHYTSDKHYPDVPNLSYRQNGTVVANPTTYVADSAMLDSMCFTDFTLMKDYPAFVRCFSRYLHASKFSEPFQELVFGEDHVYPVVLGRGCVFNCSFCGGSHQAHALIGGRTCTATRSVKSVVSSICDLARFGFSSAGLYHDCFPPADADDYYIAIFDELKRLGLSINLQIERYSLPGKHFVESFRGLAGKKSSVTLSIHTHNEQLRRRNGLFRYSNADLEDSLALMESMGVRSELFFACGLPFETKQDLEDMSAYQQTLHKKFKSLGVRTAMIEIEPGSLMSRDPESWGIRLERSSFADYYHYHGQAGRNHYQEMGYFRSGLAVRQEVTDYFCRHFCEKIHAGRLSPYVCDSVERLRKLGAFHIADKVLSFRDKS